MKYLHIIYITLLLWAVPATVLAQQFTLQGRVTDEESNPLPLAAVSCASQGRTTVCNLKGEFTLRLRSADSVVVKFSMVGYNARKRVFRRPQGKLRVDVTLPSLASLGEVVVTERRRQTTATERLDIKDAKSTPSTTGNAVEELVQQQAGVSTHNELSSTYNVRGGSFDENSVYINGIEVYRPLLIRNGQQEGLSVINSDMVESIGFSSGGYEAQYGDKMSSVLDISYHRPAKTTASAYASLLGAGAYFGAGNKKYSLSTGLRYKTSRYLLSSLDTKGEYDPRFLDFQLYASLRPNPHWTVDLIGNVADNHYNFTPTDRETNFGTMQDVKSFRVYFDGQEKDVFRTIFAAASVKYSFDDRTSLALIGSIFTTKEQEAYDIQGQYWLDDTHTQTNLGVGTYMEHTRNHLKADVRSVQLVAAHKAKQHTVGLGLTYKYETIKDKTAEYEMRDSSGYSIPHSADRLDLIYSLRSDLKLTSHRIEGFLQDTYKFRSGHEGGTLYTLCYGVRFSHWDYNGETVVSPRASLAVIPAFNQDLTFRLAAGLYYQTPFFKELRDTATVDGFTRATLNSNIKSQRSVHCCLALDYRFRMKERPYRFTAEAYYKALSNLVPYNVNNMKVTYYGENIADGHAYGLDLKLYGEFVPGTDSWITLSLMNTRQTFDGRSVPLPTDQRYGMNLHFTDYFPGTDRWRMTLRLAFADGLPFGAPHRGLGHDDFRAPAYKRADIGITYHIPWRNKSGKAKTDNPASGIDLGIDCLNLFGISNVSSYYWVTDVTNQQYAVPNYLTGRQVNFRAKVSF